MKTAGGGCHCVHYFSMVKQYQRQQIIQQQMEVNYALIFNITFIVFINNSSELHYKQFEWVNQILKKALLKGPGD